MLSSKIVIKPVDSALTLRCHGMVIAQTKRALKLYEPPLLPTYYIPSDDVDRGILDETSHKIFHPSKGEACYFNVIVKDEIFKNAAWTYKAPHDNVTEIKDFIAFSDSVVIINEDSQQ